MRPCLGSATLALLLAHLAWVELVHAGGVSGPKVLEWKRGTRIAPGSEHALLLRPGTQVKVTGDTVLEPQARIPLPTGIAGLEPYADSARLEKGRIDVTIDPKLGPASAVLVTGPRKTTVLASGGKMAMVATDEGVAVGVYSGRDATIGIGSSWKHVAPGNMILVSAEHPTGLISPLPAAPTGLRVSRPVLAVAGQNDPSRASWSPVEQAESYRVTLVGEQGSGRTLVAKAPERVLSELSPGRYELRVASVGALGLCGDDSSPALVNVVGVELPEGGYLADGKAFIEPGQQLHLTHVEGLEMTYDNAPVYFSAVGKVGLRNGRPTTVRLRVPGGEERASLEVAPRKLETEIELGPTLARWPRDIVKIQVKFPEALRQATTLEVKTTVTVNGKPVELPWVRNRDTLEGDLVRPPVYPGPWVLRVQVSDQYGHLLGHNFLEIASMAGQAEDDLRVQIHRPPSKTAIKP